jgi:stearoyl-CoA desaturase (delta-9 desaturase)
MIGKKGLAKEPRLTIENEHLSALQRRVALITVLTPFVGAVVAISLLWYTGKIGGLEIGLLLLMYVLTMFGISVGFHRQFAHRSFKAAPAVRAMLAILGSMAAQGPVIHWVSNHRRHHGHSDKPGDPHSPHLFGEGVWGQLRGFWHAHMGWLFDTDITNSLLFAKDLLQDPLILKLNRLYLVWVLLGLAIPTVLGGLLSWSWWGALNGLLWGGLVRTFLVHHATWSVNSITHLYGSRPFETDDHSTNNGWLALITAGEAWHNNHHAFPNSAMLGLKWWQIDTGGWLIRGLEKIKLVWDVTVPSVQRIEEKENSLTRGIK